MDADSISQLARECARGAAARMNALWSPDDIEDASQEAALHIWQAMGRCPDAGRGYYARAAYTGAMGWYVRQFQAHDAMRVMAGYASAGIEAERRGWHDGKPWDEPMEDERRDEVAALLARSGKRQTTAQRDAWIVQQLSRGLTQKEIGDEIGISRWHVGVLRQRVRKVLAAVAAQKGT